LQRDEVRRPNATVVDGRGGDDGEVTSPLKRGAASAKGKEVPISGTGRWLFHEEEADGKKSMRKRKPRRSGTPSSRTPDLNLPLADAAALVPAGLVNARVGQLGGGHSGPDVEEGGDALLKKQKRAINNQNVGSAAAAGSSPHRAQ
jgi:hypothetical protein